MSKPVETWRIGVVARRTPLDNPWVDCVWSPEAALPEVPDAQAGAPLGADGAAQLFYMGAATLELYPTETGFYRDNLIDGQPRLWVALRAADGAMELVHATADPTEGETMLESGADVVGVVPMPPPIAAWVAAYVEQNHVERVFHKRQRDPAGDPRKGRGSAQRGGPQVGMGGGLGRGSGRGDRGGGA